MTPGSTQVEDTGGTLGNLEPSLPSDASSRGGRGALTTDTTGMRNVVGKLGGAILAVALMGGMAVAGSPCHAGRCSAAGSTYDGGACGPRVYGPCHEPVGPIDQCDACARFAGCEGYRQTPEMLAPWQLPPGRGFQPPEAFGYRTGSCDECAACAPRGSWPRLW